MNLAEFRQQNPEYDDMSDGALLSALHTKFYSDIPFEQFAQAAGVAPVSDITGGDIVRGALQGATFNFGDELRAGASAGLGALMGQGGFSDLYGDALEYERRRYADFEREHPLAAAASEIGGGLLTGIAGGAKAATTTLGREVAENIARQRLLPRLASTAAVGGTTGAIGGGIAGVGEAETLADIPDEAARGAAIGGITSLVLGPAFELGATGVRAAGDILRRSRDPQYQAVRQVNRALDRAGYNTPELREQALATMGPDDVLADIGEAPRGLLESMANQPGSARDTAYRQLTDRSRRQAGLLLEDVGMGQRYQVIDQLADYRANQASPMYNRAFNEGVEHTDKLEKIFIDLESFAPGTWDEAERLGQLALANQSRRTGVNIPATTLRSDRAMDRPSLRGWQYIKERLDDMVDSAYRSGNAKQGGVLRDLREDLLDELDSQNDTFREARRMWAGASRFREMIDEADRFMTMPGAQFENMIKDMSPIDKEAIKVGAVQAIEDRIERGQWTQDVAKYFRTPAMQRKMRALFDDSEQYSDFMNRLNSVTRQQRTYDAVRGGSATSRREAMREETNDWLGSALDIAEVAAGSPRGLLGTAQAARSIGRNLRGLLPLPSQTDAARGATTELLLETDPVRRQLNMLFGDALQNAPLPAPSQPLIPGIAAGLFGLSAAN